MQLIHAMPLIWKQRKNESRKNAETNYVLQDHYLIKNTRVIVLEKLTVREIYSNYHQAIHTNFPKIFWQSFSK